LFAFVNITESRVDVLRLAWDVR